VAADAIGFRPVLIADGLTGVVDGDATPAP
jgi:hypothetical protein